MFQAPRAEAQRRGLLQPNHTYALPMPAEMARRFEDAPDALRNSLVIAERYSDSEVGVSLDFSTHRLPKFPFTPDGFSEFRYLYELCHAALPRKYTDFQPRVCAGGGAARR